MILPKQEPKQFSSELLSSQRIPLVEALSRERHYILGQAVELGYDIRSDLRAYRHSGTTNTCHEKAALLQQTLPEEHWSPNRVIKALYGVVGSEPYVFVLPELRMEGHAPKKKPHNGGSLRKRRTLNRWGKSFGIVNERFHLFNIYILAFIQFRAGDSDGLSFKIILVEISDSVGYTIRCQKHICLLIIRRFRGY